MFDVRKTLAHVPQRLVLLGLVPLALVVFGATGYRVVEGWSWFDSLYMSVITLTTVGFAEVHEMSTAGRAFTMALVLGGVFTIFSAASAGIKAIVGGELQGYLGRQRMERKLQNLTDHIIVCGHGRMGRRVCHEIAASGATVVVIDASEGAFVDLNDTRILSLVGDATSDVLLRTAGIDRARALISVVPKDADNLYITMSARLLNEKLFIVARAEGSDAEQKLSRAGANRVVAPYVIGGDRVVQAVLRPAVLDFIDLATRSQHLELQLEEALVHTGSKLAGQTLAATRIGEDLQLIVVAIQEHDGKMAFNPASTRVVVPGDRLLVLGHRHNLDKLEALARA